MAVICNLDPFKVVKLKHGKSNIFQDSLSYIFNVSFLGGFIRPLGVRLDVGETMGLCLDVS